MKKFFTLIIAFLFVYNPGISEVKAEEVSIQKNYVPPTLIPAGTFLDLRLEEALYSKYVKEGYIFYCALKDNFYQEDHVILPIGTIFVGKIDNLEKRGFFKKGANLGINIFQIKLINGEEISLNTTITRVGNRHINNNEVQARGNYTLAIKKEFANSSRRIKKRFSGGSNIFLAHLEGGAQAIMESGILPYKAVKNTFSKGKSLHIKKNTTIRVKTNYDVFIPPYEF